MGAYLQHWRSRRCEGALVEHQPHIVFLTKHHVRGAVLPAFLHDVKLPLTLMEVRRELAYLRDLVLLEIFDEATELWAARLTANGVSQPTAIPFVLRSINAASTC